MAKLPRVYQKIFGSLAPLADMGIFGSLAAGLPSNSLDLFDIQDTSNFDVGWRAAILGENSPAIEDMNSLFFLLFSQMAYQFQAGIPEWNALTTYYIGSLVNVAGVIYVSRADTNINHATTDGTYWTPQFSGLAQKSADYTLTAADEMVEFDATVAARTATLPLASTCKGKKFTITKTDSSANPVLVTGGAVNRYLYAQYDSTTVFSNGSTFYEI